LLSDAFNALRGFVAVWVGTGTSYSAKLRNMSEEIILTTGLYDLIKDHVRRRKVTPAEEELLTNELRRAKQVLRRDLPEDVVTVHSCVTVKDLETNQESVHKFVPPGKAKQKHKTESIMTPMGLALVGRGAGARVEWPMNDGQKSFEILKVERLN